MTSGASILIAPRRPAPRSPEPRRLARALAAARIRPVAGVKRTLAELPERGATLREGLRAALRQGRATARELSGRLGLRERDVACTSPTSLRHGGERQVIEPAARLARGFVFRSRERLTRPGACPRCRSTRIDPPAFGIESADG